MLVRTVSVVNKLRYFFLRSFAVFIGRPQQNRDRTANEPQPNRNWAAYAPQPNLNRSVRLFLDSTVKQPPKIIKKTFVAPLTWNEPHGFIFSKKTKQ